MTNVPLVVPPDKFISHTNLSDESKFIVNPSAAADLSDEKIACCVLSDPRFTQKLIVAVVFDPVPGVVLLRFADALDRNRSEFVTKFPRLRLPSKDNIEENINYVVASPPTTH